MPRYLYGIVVPNVPVVFDSRRVYISRRKTNAYKFNI